MYCPTFARFALNSRGRDFAVGDIHGSFTALQAGLDHIGFDPATDRLFSVGDLVDRGPESPDVLAWLNKPWFHAILGNHDLLTLRSAYGDPYPEVDYAMHGGRWLATLPARIQLAIADRLQGLPIAIEVETSAGLVGLVHADCPFDDWQGMRDAPWETLTDTDPLVECCLWSFARYANQYQGTVKNIRAVVHGHMLVSDMDVFGNVHFIDTGGWRSPGRFTFLDLATLTPAQGADWREAVTIIFGLDPTEDPARAKRMYDSHLARAQWMARVGYRQLLEPRMQ